MTDQTTSIAGHPIHHGEFHDDDCGDCARDILADRIELERYKRERDRRRPVGEERIDR